MINLTIHNLDESIANHLRAHAMQHGQSIEEEALQILRRAYISPSPASGLGSKISRRFAAMGGVELPLVVRSLPRQLDSLGEQK